MIGRRMTIQDCGGNDGTFIELKRKYCFCGKVIGRIKDCETNDQIGNLEEQRILFQARFDKNVWLKTLTACAGLIDLFH